MANGRRPAFSCLPPEHFHLVVEVPVQELPLPGHLPLPPQAQPPREPPSCLTSSSRPPPPVLHDSSSRVQDPQLQVVLVCSREHETLVAVQPNPLIRRRRHKRHGHRPQAHRHANCEPPEVCGDDSAVPNLQQTLPISSPPLGARGPDRAESDVDDPELIPEVHAVIRVGRTFGHARHVADAEDGDADEDTNHSDGVTFDQDLHSKQRH
eukprot:763133-Hanusia_phi.AAC.5